MQFKRLLFTITFLLNLLLAGFAQEPILLEHGGGVRTVEFSPVDAFLVASAGESNIIKLWDLRSNTAMTLRGHTGRVRSVAFSPDGELLASVSDDKTIRFWNVQSQQNIATQNTKDRYRSIAFSPDGQLLATGGRQHVKLWDVRRRMEIATLRHDKLVQAVAFSSDGQFLAAGDGSGDGPGTVKVWDIQRRQVIVTLHGDPKEVRTVVFSPGGRYLASSGWDGKLNMWHISDWTLLGTIPHTAYNDIAFSPDGKMIAGASNGSVNLWWVEDGTRVTSLPATDWRHPVDFSHDGTALAAGAEDGFVRLWRIDTSPIDGREEGAVQILHIDTYFQQLPKANSTDGNNIPEPAPPPAVVRDFFELDPFYEQWINVGGLPVIASAKVNPYAVKEAAWLIWKMIRHRPDVLRAMVGNKARFSVISYTEIITEIPEYRSDPRPDFLIYRERGWGGSEGATASSSEENILIYPGDPYSREYSVLIHEFAHAIHLLGFNTLDPTFEERLRTTYEAAMTKGLWQGTYASRDIREYWAEGAHAWFYPKGRGSFRFGKTRQALKRYDPGLAALLTEVYGNTQWRYTLPETRTHLPHLQRFNPQDSPTFQGWPELAAVYRQLRDPNSDGGGAWVNLKRYRPNQLQRLLTESDGLGNTTIIIFVNFTQADVFIYRVASDGVESYSRRVPPDYIRYAKTPANYIWLVKDSNGRKLAVFQAKAQIGRALIGATPREILKKPTLTVDVNADGKVNKTDLLRVVNALGKKATPKMHTDVNTDGVVDVADLLLVIEHLDNPKDAAAPTHQKIMILLNPEMLSEHLSILYAQNDGTLKYQQAIGFLENLLGAAYPERTLLHPNYPNPFNPETWIPYQLSKPAEVTLTIYAVNGNVVRRLALGHQPAGMYHSKSRSAYWDGRNEQGERVASGVYFYTLSAEDFTATRRMFIRK